jgi:uncharacterized membrane protein
MNNSSHKWKALRQEIKSALESRNIVVLLIFAVIFVLATMATMSFAFGAFFGENFSEVFWVSAFFEVVMAVIAVLVCSLYGAGDGNSQKPLLVWVKKLFRN